MEIRNETETVSVTQLLETMVLVNIEINVWSAKRKMVPEDFGGVDLPPEKLASLGSKNIFDPTAIEPLTRIRGTAHAFLRRHGIRFGSGFIVSEDRLFEISETLEELRKEFDALRDSFLQDYDRGVQDWINDTENRDWRHIIAGSVVDRDYVADKIRYRWHALKVQPAGASDFLTDTAEIPSLLWDEIAAEAKALLKSTCAEGREKGFQKSLNPFRAIRNKLESLSFVDSRAAAIADGIDAVLSGIPAGESFGATHMDSLRQLARNLSEPKFAKAYAKRLLNGEDAIVVSQPAQPSATKVETYVISQPAAPAAPASDAAPEPPAATAEVQAPAVEAPVAVSEIAAPVEAAPVPTPAVSPAPLVEEPAPRVIIAPRQDMGIEPSAVVASFPLTNEDLSSLYGEEAQTMSHSFDKVPEDILRKALGL
jgi:hypothetical protein